MRVTDEMVERACRAYLGGTRWDADHVAHMRRGLEAALADVPEPSPDMLASLQQWWEQHALALRMTSRSVHAALGTAISALEQGKPFPTMQVLADVPEPVSTKDWLAAVKKAALAAESLEARIAELEAEVARLREQLAEVRKTLEEMSDAAERGDNDAPQRLLRSWARELRAALGEEP